jgi:hypothetical protein
MDFLQTKTFLIEAGFKPKEWRELQAICEIQQGNYSAKATGKQMLEVDVGDEYMRLFYDRLKDLLLGQEKTSVAPLHVLRKAQPRQYALVKKCAAELYKIACEWNGSRVRHRNFTIGVFHMYVKLTIQYLKDCSVPVSAKAVLQHSDKFIGLVDRSYPGYVKSGAMHIVILGHKEGQPSA